MQYATLDEIIACAEQLPALVRRTPIIPFAGAVNEIGDEKLFLKLENFQAIGAYKVRAAFAALNALSASERARGVVLTSSGNFAQAFALAGKHYGAPIVVVMLAETSPYKIDAARALGAEVDLFHGPALDRQRRVEEIGRARNMTVVDTWEEHSIVVGHGTLGLEMFQQMPDVEQVLVPVSSGGMAAGVATAIKELAPHVRVVGVQPVGANAAYLSLAAGVPVSIDNWRTVADGLSARRPGERPFAHIKKYIDEIVLIEELDIAKAHMALRRRSKIVAEAAGSVASAAFIAGKVNTTLRTVSVVSGGNLTERAMHTLEKMAE